MVQWPSRIELDSVEQPEPTHGSLTKSNACEVGGLVPGGPNPEKSPGGRRRIRSLLKSNVFRPKS
mgnify:CR=1 FL=1